MFRIYALRHNEVYTQASNAKSSLKIVDIQKERMPCLTKESQRPEDMTE